MVKLIHIFNQLKPARIAVIGDYMYDIYTFGKVHRISPEAPVSILHVKKQQSLPGGAGNVCLNLKALGAEVLAIGRVGRDDAGYAILKELSQEEIVTEGIVFQETFQTPVKNRFIAESQQILRVDFEMVTLLASSLEHELTQKISSLLDSVQLIAISDYGKGFLTPSFLKTILKFAKEKGIPTIVDPKGDDFTKYQGATIIKPNLQEAYIASKLPLKSSLEEVAYYFLNSLEIESLIITRSEEGISLFNHHIQKHFPVLSKEVKDVTGAGDTVLATLSLALANGLSLEQAIPIANLAAGLAIERVGCAPIQLAHLASHLLSIAAPHKVFDEEHLEALGCVLKGKDYTLLGLEKNPQMSLFLLKTIQKLSRQSEDHKLVIYIPDAHPNEEFLTLLSSFSEVDYVITHCESLKTLCETIHPYAVYLLSKDQLSQSHHFCHLLPSAS